MDLLYFTARTIIVVFVVTLAMVFALLTVGHDIEDLVVNRLYRIKMAAIAQIENPQHLLSLASGVARIAQDKMDLPADQKQKVMDDLKTIGDRWRPYVAALAGPNACQTPAAQGDTPR